MGSILIIIRVGLQETQALLSEVGPHCIDTCILKIQNHRLITLKVLRNVIPELFRHQLPQRHHVLLSEEEYLQNETMFDCFYGRDSRWP
jgi:hypothetical protein